MEMRGEDNIFSFVDHYALLGIPRDATTPQIYDAFARKVVNQRPEVLSAYSRALEVLSDPELRAELDRQLAASKLAPAVRPEDVLHFDGRPGLLLRNLATEEGRNRLREEIHEIRRDGAPINRQNSAAENELVLAKCVMAQARYLDIKLDLNGETSVSQAVQNAIAIGREDLADEFSEQVLDKVADPARRIALIKNRLPRFLKAYDRAGVGLQRSARNLDVLHEQRVRTLTGEYLARSVVPDVGERLALNLTIGGFSEWVFFERNEVDADPFLVDGPDLEIEEAEDIERLALRGWDVMAVDDQEFLTPEEVVSAVMKNHFKGLEREQFESNFGL